MIASTETKAVYLGDGITTQFPIPFNFLEKSHVQVSIYNTETGTEDVLESDYYVDANLKVVSYPGYKPGEEPPEIEQPEKLDEKCKLIIWRKTPRNQLQDLGGKYPLNLLERADDKLTYIVQEMTEEQKRTVKLPMGTTKNPETVLEHLDEVYNDIGFIRTAVVQTAEDALSAKESMIAAKNSEFQAVASEVNAAKSEQIAKDSGIIAIDCAEKSIASETASTAWAVSEASPDGLVDSHSPTMFSQSSRSWALCSRDNAVEAARSEKNADDYQRLAEGAAAQVQAVVDNAVQVILNNMSAGSRIFIAGDDQKIYSIANVVDETGYVLAPSTVSISESAPAEGVSLWLRLRR